MTSPAWATRGGTAAEAVAATVGIRRALAEVRPEGKAAETNYRLGTQLPYMFVITRLSHYLKVLQREQIGSWKSRSDLDRELNSWIRQYVSDMPDPTAETRSRKPLKKARIVVEEVEGQVGWFRCSLHVLPHLKFEGAEFELSLVGKLDKS